MRPEFAQTITVKLEREHAQSSSGLVGGSRAVPGASCKLQPLQHTGAIYSGYFMDDQQHLDRINALTRNARSSWFALLAALVFVAITLMGVENIDFYGVDRATKLPLINVEVSTRYFFITAPILITAIYCYFHLHLIRFWDALGDAPARIERARLADAVTPWLVTDAALHYRCRERNDDVAMPRALDRCATWLNFVLAWGFGLLVLLFIWWFAWPARTWWMTAIASLALVIGVFVGANSYATMRASTGVKDNARLNMRPVWIATILGALPFFLSLCLICCHNKQGILQRFWVSELDFVGLDLSDENIVERPLGWLHYEHARAEFREGWCRREQDGKNCTDFGENEDVFSNEFTSRRAATRRIAPSCMALAGNAGSGFAQC